MSVNTESGRLTCTITNVEFGPDFGSQEVADEFLAFIGYYPSDWKERSSFSVVSKRDPRDLGEDELMDRYRRFMRERGESPTERRWRTLVCLERRKDRVFASLPGWGWRINIEMDVNDGEGHDPRNHGSIKFLGDPELTRHAIPIEIYEALPPDGTLVRTHCLMNIGAEAWEDLAWPAYPEGWEELDIEGRMVRVDGS